VDGAAVTAEEALELARRHGVNVMLDGDSLHLEADAPPPNGLLAILGRGKWDIVAVLRQRGAEERRRIIQWVADNFTSSPADVCAHCGGGARYDDPFVHAVRRNRQGRGAQLMSLDVDDRTRSGGPESAGNRTMTKRRNP
jgi:hypothetical protein